MGNLNKKGVKYPYKMLNRRITSNNIFKQINITPVKKNELFSKLADKSDDNTNNSNYNISNNNNNNSLSNDRKLKIFYFDNKYINNNNIIFRNRQDSSLNRKKTFKTKRLNSTHINKISDFFNIKLLNKFSVQNDKNTNMLFSNNIYLPKIIKNNYDFILRNINKSRNKETLKKSNSVEHNNNNIFFHQINFPTIKKTKNIKNIENINNNHNQIMKKNNSTNKIKQIKKASLVKKNLMRCSSCMNTSIKKIKSIYYPLVLNKNKNNNNNNNISNDYSKSAIYIDNDYFITSKYHKFHKLDNYLINSFKDISKKKNISNIKKITKKTNKVNIDSQKNNLDIDMMLNDKGTLIYSFYKKQ